MEPANYVEIGSPITKLDCLIKDLKNLLGNEYNNLFYKIAGSNLSIFPNQFDLMEKSWLEFLLKNKFEVVKKDYKGNSEYNNHSCLLRLINYDKHKIKDKIILDDLWMDGTVNPKFYLLISLKDAQKIVALKSFLN